MIRRAIYFVAIALLWCAELSAQNTIVGEKIPDMSISKWLMDMQPTSTEYTCILFHHSESELCKKSLSRIEQMVMNNQDMNLVIVTKEKYGDAGVALTEHLEDRVGVAFDENGRTFRYFGVKFIPFCVIHNKKSRVKWCGNPLSLSQTTLDKITSNR